MMVEMKVVVKVVPWEFPTVDCSVGKWVDSMAGPRVESWAEKTAATLVDGRADRKVDWMVDKWAAPKAAPTVAVMVVQRAV